MTQPLYTDAPFHTIMSDDAEDTERKAIERARKAIAVCRSELLDCQAAMVTTSNRDDLQDILDGLPCDAGTWEAKRVLALEEELAGL